MPAMPSTLAPRFLTAEERGEGGARDLELSSFHDVAPLHCSEEGVGYSPVGGTEHIDDLELDAMSLQRPWARRAFYSVLGGGMLFGLVLAAVATNSTAPKPVSEQPKVVGLQGSAASPGGFGGAMTNARWRVPMSIEGTMTIPFSSCAGAVGSATAKAELASTLRTTLANDLTHPINLVTISSIRCITHAPRRLGSMPGRARRLETCSEQLVVTFAVGPTVTVTPAMAVTACHSMGNQINALLGKPLTACGNTCPLPTVKPWKQQAPCTTGSPPAPAPVPHPAPAPVPVPAPSPSGYPCAVAVPPPPPRPSARKPQPTVVPPPSAPQPQPRVALPPAAPQPQPEVVLIGGKPVAVPKGLHLPPWALKLLNTPHGQIPPLPKGVSVTSLTLPPGVRLKLPPGVHPVKLPPGAPKVPAWWPFSTN